MASEASKYTSLQDYFNRNSRQSVLQELESEIKKTTDNFNNNVILKQSPPTKAYEKHILLSIGVTEESGPFIDKIDLWTYTVRGERRRRGKETRRMGERERERLKPLFSSVSLPSFDLA